MGQLRFLPCVDSADLAAARRAELDIPQPTAAALGHSAVAAIRDGRYETRDGQLVDWSAAVQAALAARLSIPPNATLPPRTAPAFAETRVGVANETTLAAGRRLTGAGLRPLALNFANGVNPGGGFLFGARAQEEVLCRSSALYATLDGDAMYAAHQQQGNHQSSDWVILSPDVPVFRDDDGTPRATPWLLTSRPVRRPTRRPWARPGRPTCSALASRACSPSPVPTASRASCSGAWGCGAFANEPERTARDFRSALEGELSGSFREVVFAIADWSPERKFLGPFRDVLR